MHPIFSIEESLRFGWSKTRQHSGLLFKVLLALFALEVATSLVRQVLEGTIIGSLALFVLFGLGVILGTGFTVIVLKIAKGEHVKFKDIVPPTDLVLNVFLASLLVGILTLSGLVLLLIPGIYFMVRFAFVKFAVIDGSTIAGSFDKSTALTEGHKWPLLGFLAVIILLNIVGALLFMVGLLITVPVTMIAFAHIYVKLKAHHHNEHTKHEPAV